MDRANARPEVATRESNARPDRVEMTRGAQYLLALYVAEQRGAGRVAPGDVDDTVDRTPAATTEMLQRLAERELVTHEAYEGAALTVEGEEAAADLYETYRTLARFFDEVLGLDDSEREAIRLAGTVSPEVTERLASTLLSDVDAENDLSDADTDSDLPNVDSDPTNVDSDPGNDDHTRSSRTN
jgi:Mn-dependent DtxR family transcriptional regulator